MSLQHCWSDYCRRCKHSIPTTASHFLLLLLIPNCRENVTKCLYNYPGLKSTLPPAFLGSLSQITVSLRSWKEHATDASNTVSIFNELLLVPTLSLLVSRLCASDKWHSSIPYLFLSDQSLEEHSLFSSAVWPSVWLPSNAFTRCIWSDFFIGSESGDWNTFLVSFYVNL